MTQRTWVIVGATSIIAEEFAHLVAGAGHALRLVGRDSDQLELIAKDIKLRHHVPCETLFFDSTKQPEYIVTPANLGEGEFDLFIALSDSTDNAHLNNQSITQLIGVNVLVTTLLIHAYLNTHQTQHHLLYLSSVAACRGRAKNSLYGASKAAIEIYLEGLQQAASQHQHITIAKLGFIDTKQTYGVSGIFYAAPPAACAKACLHAMNRKRRRCYYPSFWRAIMAIITRLPFFIYKKMRSI